MKVSEVGIKMALELVAKWFCGKKQLRVNWHKGNSVCADMKNCTIHIPIAACSGDFDKKVLVMLRGNVYHESAHILLSDIPSLEGTAAVIANGLEDIRIEAETSKMGEGIRATYVESNTDLSFEHVKTFSNRNENTPPYWKEALFALMFEHQFIKIWKMSNEAQKLFDIAKPVFGKVSGTKSTKDCEKLAVEIYELWKDAIKEEKQKQNQKEEEKNQADSEEDKPGNKKSKKGKPSKKESKEFDKKAEAEAIKELEQGAEDEDINPLKELIGKEADRVMKDPDFYTSFREKDLHLVFQKNDLHLQKFNEIRNSIGADVSTMVHAAEEAFLSMKMSEVQHGTVEGDLDYTMLTQICKGLSESVFCKTQEGHELNTAIAIVIDQSSSMGHGVMNEVKKVLISVGELLTKLEINFEIFGTTTYDHYMDNKAFTRYRGMKFMHYKFFNESWNFVKSKIMNLAGIDNNLDGEGLEYAEAVLAQRPESRKVILSICDGQPESGQDNNDVFGRHLEKTAKRIRKSGMEVYAIGINTDRPAIYYGKDFFINVTSGDQNRFSKDVITSLVNTIIKGRFKK